MAKEVTGFIKLQIKGGASEHHGFLQAVQCPHSGQRW